MQNTTSERAEISEHEVRVYLALQQSPDKWMTHKDIENIVKFHQRTVRAHTLRLVKLGIVDVAALFPRHRYRYSTKGHKRNRAYTQRLEEAAEIMGLTRGK